MRGEADREQALELLQAFASVRVKAFALTLTDLEGKKLPQGYYSHCSLEQLRHTLGPMLRAATAHQHNVIVRPAKSESVELVQLDDLAEPDLGRLSPVSLVVLRTSPGNGQSWVAVEDATPDFARRLRQGTRADTSASGATRIAGSRNFKAQYAPHFPTIEILASHPGNVVPRAMLESRELVAPLEEAVSYAASGVSYIAAAAMAELPALCRARAARQGRRASARHQQGGFRLVDDRPGLGME